MQEILNMCISFRNQNDIFVNYLIVTHFQFQFPLFVCFYRMADWTWSERPILRFETRVKDELLDIQLMRMNHVPELSRNHADWEYNIVYGVECKGSEFIGSRKTDKFTHKQAYKLSPLYISTDDRYLHISGKSYIMAIQGQCGNHYVSLPGVRHLCKQVWKHLHAE